MHPPGPGALVPATCFRGPCGLERMLCEVAALQFYQQTEFGAPPHPDHSPLLTVILGLWHVMTWSEHGGDEIQARHVRRASRS